VDELNTAPSPEMIITLAAADRGASCFQKRIWARDASTGNDNRMSSLRP
jgi:hypothetical protein